MRREIAIVGLASLAACSGSGPQTAGGTAAPSGNINTGTTSAHTFVNPTETKTYQAQAAVQSYDYTYTERVRYNKVPVVDAGGNPVLDGNGHPTYKVDPTDRTLQTAYQNDQLYKGNTSTVRSPGVTVTYDPKNAQYTLQISQDGLTDNITFQDPAHRTDFSGALKPQDGVPNLEVGDPSTWRTKGVQYLQADTGSSGQTYDVSTFFYELPGTTTKYVTYAGFVRNHFDAPGETVAQDGQTYQDVERTRGTALERAAFVYGEQTANNAVPTTGTASYSGNMIASMVNNPTLDQNPLTPSYFQWITGTANVAVDFGTGNVNTTLTGTALDAMRDTNPISLPADNGVATKTGGFTPPDVAIPAGSTFSATSSARIDLVQKGGFTGSFSDAHFTTPGGNKPVDIVGSTIDGAFYGPKADEVGASFRIVGGTPDQRVDIMGSFTGAKP